LDDKIAILPLRRGFCAVDRQSSGKENVTVLL
jgi:hypothetical protein